jgi:hypothetical protein
MAGKDMLLLADRFCTAQLSRSSAWLKKPAAGTCTCGSARHLPREARMLAMILSLEVLVQVLMFQDLYVVFTCCLPESG